MICSQVVSNVWRFSHFTARCYCICRFPFHWFWIAWLKWWKSILQFTVLQVVDGLEWVILCLQNSVLSHSLSLEDSIVALLTILSVIRTIYMNCLYITLHSFNFCCIYCLLLFVFVIKWSTECPEKKRPKRFCVISFL